MPVPRRRRRAWAAWLAWLVLSGTTVAATGVVGTEDDTGLVTAAAGDRADGGELYQRWCAVCHATDGSGTTAGPSLADVSVAYLDLVIRTGRMPLPDRSRGVAQRRFDDVERAATVAYVTDLLDLDGTIPEVSEGSPGAGRSVYSVHCASCHGATGSGGLAGDGTPIPPVVGLDAVAIAEATREGPFEMPRFTEQVISDSEIGHLAAFLDEQARPAPTPLGFTELNRALATAFAGAMALVVIGACVWASRPPSQSTEDDG